MFDGVLNTALKLSLKIIFIHFFEWEVCRNWLINISCGGYGSFLAWGWLFLGLGVGEGGGLWALSKVETSARAAHLPRATLLVNFSDTLLVVSILDIVYDCHLWLLLQS